MMTDTPPIPSPPTPVEVLARDLVAGDPSPGAPASLALADGRTLVMVVEADDADPMDDMGEGTWTGRVEFGTRSRTTGYDQRPDGMDGRARKLPTRDGDPIWWQVPDDVPADAIPTMARNIADLLEYGWRKIGVKLRETVTDSSGGAHTVTVREAWLGGIEPFPDADYLAYVAADLVAEVLA